MIVFVQKFLILFKCKFIFKPLYSIFNTLQQSWKMFMHSVCLSVCARSKSHKYSSNVLKLIHAIHMWHNRNWTENGNFTTNHLSKENPNFSDILRPMGKKYLKHILYIAHVTHLYCTKYNEIYIGHSCIQKQVSYKKWCKSTNFKCKILWTNCKCYWIHILQI